MDPKQTATDIGIEVGATGSFKLPEESLEKEAAERLASIFGIALSEAQECFQFIKSENRDGNKQYSDLYARCNGKNNGEVKWMKNHLDLVFSYRWAEDSEMIVDVKLRDHQDLELRHLGDHQDLEMPAVAG